MGIRPSNRTKQHDTIEDVIRRLEVAKKNHPEDAAWYNERIAYWQEQLRGRNKKGQYTGGFEK